MEEDVDRYAWGVLAPPEDEELNTAKGFYVREITLKIGFGVWDFLSPEIQNLLISSQILVRLITDPPKEWLTDRWLLDYSFAVYPAAKAFEGFLKDLAVYKKFTFKEGGLFKTLTDNYLNRKDPDFAIGRIFDLNENQKIEASLLDRKRFKHYPKSIQGVWGNVRNKLMHFDRGKPEQIDVGQAISLVSNIHEAIKMAYEGYIGSSSQDLKYIEDWVTGENRGAEQWASYKELGLDGKILKSLRFVVQSDSPYWRAGFKITSPNGSPLPLVSPKSMLFHIGSDNGANTAMSAYLDGGNADETHKVFNYNNGEPTTVEFKVNAKNFASVFVNGNLEYQQKVNRDFLRKAYLVTWGDNHEFTIKTSDITYSVG